MISEARYRKKMRYMLAWHLITFAALIFACLSSHGADNLVLAKPGGNINNMYLLTTDGHEVPAIVSYTSDGNGNIIPISSGGGGSSNVNVLNFPAIQAVSQSGVWTVTANQGTSPWVISGGVSITGSVSVTQGTSPWVVGGTVAVSNFPATQPISGTVTANQGTSPWVTSVSNFPATQAVTQSTSPWVVSGTISAAQSGTWTVQQGTPPWSVSQSGAWTTGRTWNLSSGADSVTAIISGTVPISGTITANQGTSPWVVSGTVGATQSGAWTTGRTWTLSSGIDSISASVSNFPASDQVEGISALGAPATENPVLMSGVDGFSGIKSSITTLPISGISSVAIADLTRPQGGTSTGAIINGSSQFVPIPTDQINAQNLYVDVSGTFVGNLQASYIGLGGGSQGVQFRNVGTGTLQSVITSGGNYLIEGVDPTKIQIESDSWISGSAGVAVTASTDVSGLYAYQSGDWNIANITGSMVLPDNAAQESGGNLASINSKIPSNLTVTSNRLLVDGSGVTLTVALPSGASTSANQTNGTQKSQQVDGSGNVQPAADIASRKLFVANTDGTNTAAVKAASTAAVATDPALVVAVSPNNTIAATQSGTWTSRITDGTNTAAVKAASTAAVAADPALVVAISPNNTISVSSRITLTANAAASVTVAATTTALVASNANRKGLIVTNLSVNTVSIGIGASAVLNTGITLYPGGVWYMDAYSFSTSAINAIASAGSSAVAVQEFQ